jgi:hypothetical protein
MPHSQKLTAETRKAETVELNWELLCTPLRRQFLIMKRLTLLFSTAIAAVILNSCVSNQPASSTTTTTTTTTHQQGTGLPSQTMERHGM